VIVFRAHKLVLKIAIPPDCAGRVQAVGVSSGISIERPATVFADQSEPGFRVFHRVIHIFIHKGI